MTTARTVEAIGVALLLQLTAHAAAAQRIRGIVYLPDSTTAVGGVIVEARDSTGRMIMQGLSNESGTFQLDLPSAGEVDLRALRVGYQPTAGPRVAVAPGAITTAGIILTDQHVPLSGVAVQGRQQCRVAADAGQLIAAAWTEARKALESTRLKSPDGTVMAHWTVSDVSTDLKETLVLSDQTVEQQSPTSHPFTSLPPDSLARVGYVSYARGIDAFTAPDADVLLSDSFVRTHCFQIAKTDPRHAGWVGIAFSPVQDRRGFSDIDGTLWVDRATAELKRIDYRYTELAPQVAKADPSGWVEFMHLDSGIWFVSRWSIRMPRTARYDSRDWTPGAFERDVTATSRLVVDALQTRTGMVKSIVRNDGAALFMVASGVTPGAGTDSLAQTSSLCGGITADSKFAMLFGRLLDSSNQPVPNATVLLQWQDNSKCTMDGACTFDEHDYTSTTNESGAWWFCGVPAGLPVSLVAELRGKFRRRLTAEVPGDRKIARVDIPVYWP